MRSMVWILLSGTLVFGKGKPPEIRLMPPDSLHWDSMSFFGRTVQGEVVDGATLKPPVFEKFRLDEAGTAQARPGGKLDEESSLGARICRIVEDTLADAFGKRGGKPDFHYLSGVFQGGHKGILKGKVKPGQEEIVEYFWVTPSEWIDSLKESVARGRRFDVDLAIIWMYQDVHSSNRFWAVVKQQWVTKDIRGKMLYRDDGFLFLNFDLDEKGNPRNIKVNYRLWFYNYRNKDRKTGMPPHQRIARDIRGALDPNSRLEVNVGRLEGDRWVADPKERGISGIDRDLVTRMAEDLVKGIRSARGE